MTDRQGTTGRRLRALRGPLACSAVSAAALAALFAPVPAWAAPAPAVPPAAGVPAAVTPNTPVTATPGAGAAVGGTPVGGAPVGVPDTGARPAPRGTVLLPGQTAPANTPATTTGIALTPLVAKIEKQRADIAALGDRLIQLGVDRDTAQGVLTAARQKVTSAQTAMTQAQQEAATAAADSLREAAAQPPGAGTGLPGLEQLGTLADLQRGDTTSESAARRVKLARTALDAALAEQSTAAATSNAAIQSYQRLDTEVRTKQTALQTLERQNAAELSAAEASQNAADAALGEGYLNGAADGRGADPRAAVALTFALQQVGKPYVWSEEGPESYDCSGLMWAAYRKAGFQLNRVSRDQYSQTRQNAVDRYSLLPGDLLFFSSSNSWTNIHHVAMYAGEGKMVEAPRTGLNVRVVPVRWSRLFQATRVFGSVAGGTTVVPAPAVPPVNPPAGTPVLTPPPPPTTRPPGGTTSPPKPTPGTTTTGPKPTGTPRPTNTQSSKPPTTPSSTPTTPKPSPSTTPPTPTPSATPSASPSTAPGTDLESSASPEPSASSGD